ncbi:SGNH/GDSL hydrolase family protein [Streptomyces sp. NPDC051940]|uniref:SGNH/GDSL hydrolase family protein n=1 Tax=Streptomyces sp. NPDC051940 TaxID=3155675 RepID=UPI00343BD40D
MEQQGLSRKQLLGMAAAGAGALVLGPGLPRAYADGDATYADGDATAGAAEAQALVDEAVDWYDVSQWGVEGRGWSDTARFYDRLPARAQASVRPVIWNLSRNSAGMATRFRTDATAVYVRYTLRSTSLALPHMPATGVSGIDLYARDEATGRDRWAAVVKPAARTVETALLTGIDPGMRQFTAYLPLYNGVDSLEFGVPAGSAFRPVTPRERRPVIIYGSSIAQGACASRPGMAFSAILGRRFDRPVINLGFSGNAFMEPEVGALLAELDPEVFVVDALPNMEADLVAERGEPLIRQLRAARPETPVVMAEDRTYANAWLSAGLRERQAASRAAYREAYRSLLTSGVQRLIYLAGEDQLGSDDEATTDGSHPSDLGMVRYADAYTQVLQRVLHPDVPAPAGS